MIKNVTYFFAGEKGNPGFPGPDGQSGLPGPKGDRGNSCVLVIQY